MLSKLFGERFLFCISRATFLTTDTPLLSDANITSGESTSVIWAYKSVSQTAQSDLDNIGQHGSRGSTSITFE